MNSDYTYIKDYIDGNLHADQREQFELRLREDVVFKKAYESQLKFRLGLDELVAEDIRSYIDHLNHAKEDSVDRRGVRTLNLMLVLGGLFILILLSIIFFKKAYSSEDVFSRFYKAPVAETVRSTDSENTDAIVMAYFEAHNMIAKGRYEDALYAFRQIDVTADHKLADNVEWFEILLLIKLGSAEGEEMLKELGQDEEHKYSNEITTLIDVLDLEDEN